MLVGNIEKLKWKKPDLEYEYIVLYGYEYRFSKEECDKILHFAKSENCKVIALGERQFKSDIFIKCRPDEVLGYFSEAKYIITDSFHGCVFSIIFNKSFWVIANPQRGLSRITSLLTMFGLQDRLISSPKEIVLEKIRKEINWHKVNRIKEQLREKGREYLSQRINTTI